jgi:hypothetical protein
MIAVAVLASVLLRKLKDGVDILTKRSRLSSGYYL